MRKETFRTGRLYPVHVTRIAPVLRFLEVKQQIVLPVLRNVDYVRWVEVT
jgi:hypothetical protein